MPLASRSFCASFALACFVLSLWFLGAESWISANTWTLDNDHLAPYDYLAKMADGVIYFGDILHARIPSLFPDFIAQGVAMLAVGRGVGAFSWAYLLLLGMSLVSYFAVASVTPGRNNLLKAVSASAVLLFLLCSSSFAGILFLSGLPARHGGNWINTGVAMYLSLLLLGSSGRRRSWCSALLFVLVLLAVFSNRLFVVSFVVPFGVSLLVSALLPRTIRGWDGSWPFRSASSFLSTVALGSLVGIAGYFVVMHQCHEVEPGFVVDKMFVNLRYLWENGVLIFYVLAIASLLFRLSLSRCGSGWSSTAGLSQADFVGLLAVWLSALLGLFVFSALKSPVADSDGIRYLISSAFALAVVLSYELRKNMQLIAAFLLVFSGRELLWKLPMPDVGLSLDLPGRFFAVFGGLLVLLGVLPSVQGGMVAAYQASYKSRIDWLDSRLRSAGLVGSTGYVVNPPWNSRALEMLLPGGGKVLTVSSDGNPYLFHHSRVQFVKSGRLLDSLSPSATEVVSPAWVLTAPHERERMYKYYGMETKNLGCYRPGECLYLFDASATSYNTATFLSSWQADYYGCLKVGSRLELIRSALRRRLGLP